MKGIMGPKSKIQQGKFDQILRLENNPLWVDVLSSWPAGAAAPPLWPWVAAWSTETMESALPFGTKEEK